MDEKTPYGVAYSRASSRHTGKSSCLQDSNNLMCQNPSRLFSSSVDHQKPLPSKTSQGSSQKRIVAGRINRTVKNNVPKNTPNLLETSGSNASPKAARVREALSDTNSANHQHLIEDREQIRREPGCRSLYAPTFSFTQRLIASRDAKKATKNCSHGTKTGTKNCGSKRNSSSTSNVIPSVCSQSISSPNRRETKTITGGFSTSSKRKLSGSPNTRLSNSSTPNSTRMINKSITDHLGMIKSLKHSDTGTTVRRHARGNPASSSRSLDSELDYSPSSRNFRIRSASGRLTSSPERGKMLLYDHSSNTDAHMHNKTEGVEEEEPESNENEQDGQMLQYESNFILHDQHEEMRMDIDDMSYEELLDLSEKIGSVSTGLTDEALEKCLQRSSFKLSISSSGSSELIQDGNICSICQEECDDGEEIGTLACEHWYHPVCIQYWLRQKNWCPICKAPASVDNNN